MEFISYEGPSQSRADKTRQTIRSYVTKRQHRLRREAEQRELDEYQPHRADDNSLHHADTSPDLGQGAPSGKISRRSSLQNGRVSSRSSESSLSSRKAAVSKNALSRMFPPPSLPPRVPFEPMLPCDTALNTLESYIHTTMVPTHVAALGLDPLESRLASQWFSSSSISEPALYTSALLTATANFKHASPELILYLQSTTITSLVHALADTERRQSPALILAVECLTFYECLHGDKTLAQRVHRPAMRRLIRAHGGRDGVEIPLSWKKVSLMADIIMEIQMGSEGDISFLHDETHQNGGILEAEWTEALRIYLPDVDEKFPRTGAPMAS